MRHRALWVTWENQVRNRSVSHALGIPLREIISSAPPLLRHLVCSIRTIICVAPCRGGLVVVQSPSLGLAVLGVALSRVLRFKLVIDAHNAGLAPCEGRSRLLTRLAHWTLRNADLVLVSNRGLASSVLNIGGTPHVFPDPLPRLEVQIQEHSGEATGYQGQVVFICTWASDEPVEEVLRAAELVPHVRIVITGKPRRTRAPESLSENVVLAGFLSRKKYEELLVSSDVAMDLTTRSDCLVCGAYEAVVAERPFVLSDTPALRNHFRIGGVHVSNNAVSIADGIRSVLDSYPRYRREVIDLKRELLFASGQEVEQLRMLLGLTASRPSLKC